MEKRGTAVRAMKSRRKALRVMSQEKVVNISNYRDLRNGRSARKVALVTTDKNLIEGLKEQLKDQAELQAFDGRFALEQGLKSGEWDGILLDERTLSKEALTLCEKIKRQGKFEELFVVILSNDASKDLVREGYEKGCDEWITKVDDYAHLARLVSHHMNG